jgi:hypothetical protein
MAGSDTERPSTPAVSGPGSALRRPGFPGLLIGSSNEQLSLSLTLMGQLEAVADVTLWYDDTVLVHPRPRVVELLERTTKVNYAVLVLGEDDIVASSPERGWQIHDGVALALGLFVALFGRERVFCLAPDGEGPKRLSELLGVAPFVYRQSDGEPTFEDVIAAAQEVSRAVRATWQPVPPMLLDRYNDLRRRFHEASRMALARRCESSGKPVPDCLTEEDVCLALNKMLPKEVLPAATSDAFSLLRAVTDEIASSARDEEWERRLSMSLDRMQQNVVQCEKWVRDEQAWERLESYFAQMSRYEVLVARAKMAAAAVSRLLAAATGVMPPVDINEESAEAVLAHLVEKTDVTIGMPSLPGFRPRYVWPDDRSGYRVETALEPLQKEIARLEAFAASGRVPGLLAECHSLQERHKRILLATLAEVHRESPRSPDAPPPATSLQSIEMYYLAGKGYLRDCRLRAPKLHSAQYLGEMLRRPDGTDEWQDEFQFRMNVLTSELAEYEKWQSGRRAAAGNVRQ